MRIVVDELLIGPGLADPHKRVCAIAFEMNALIPIVKRRRAWLFFNDAGPGIFAWRLIEVTVDDERRHGNI
jgi:hypothetical protein